MTMNRDYVVKHNLVERYLRNELSDDEVADFEAFYMDDPETLDELEAAQILLSQKKMPEAVKGESVVPGDFSPRGGAPARAGRNPWQWVSGALAAALVVAVVFPDRDQPTPIGNTQDLVFDLTRSSGLDSSKINIHSEIGAVVLRVAVAEATSPYTLKLSSENGAVLVTGLVPDGYGEVTAVVPAAIFDSGSDWSLSVSSADFQFRRERSLEIVILE